MVSLIGWLDGLTAGGIVISSVIFGLFFLYESRKYETQLLRFVALTIFFIGMLWFGPFCDLISLLLTGKNLPFYLYGILSYMWVGPAIICGMYIGGLLLFPNKKWYLVGFYAVLGLIFEFFLFFDIFNAIRFSLANPGEDIIDLSMNRMHPTFYIVTFFLISVLIFEVMGFLIKALQSEGIVRKKFIFLSCGFGIFVLAGIFDGLTSPGIFLFIIRFLMMSFAVWMYLALRVEPEKKEKLKSKNDIKIEGDLFRISRTKPVELTEEEISISKERKICLICKNRTVRFNIYICPECDALYCMKCAQAMSNLENMCWVCETPFDESKPVRPYKKQAEEVEVKKLKIPKV